MLHASSYPFLRQLIMCCGSPGLNLHTIFLRVADCQAGGGVIEVAGLAVVGEEIMLGGVR